MFSIKSKSWSKIEWFDKNFQYFITFSFSLFSGVSESRDINVKVSWIQSFSSYLSSAFSTPLFALSSSGNCFTRHCKKLRFSPMLENRKHLWNYSFGWVNALLPSLNFVHIEYDLLWVFLARRVFHESGYISTEYPKDHKIYIQRTIIHKFLISFIFLKGVATVVMSRKRI